MTYDRVKAIADELEQLAVMFPEFTTYLEDAATMVHFVDGRDAGRAGPHRDRGGRSMIDPRQLHRTCDQCKHQYPTEAVIASIERCLACGHLWLMCGDPFGIADPDHQCMEYNRDPDVMEES